MPIASAKGRHKKTCDGINWMFIEQLIYIREREKRWSRATRVCCSGLGDSDACWYARVGVTTLLRALRVRVYRRRGKRIDK